MSSNESNDGFVCVNQSRTRRQKNRRKYKLNEKHLKLLNDLKEISCENNFDLNSFELRIDSSINELKKTRFLSVIFDALDRCLAIGSTDRQPTIGRIVCYGLGNFTISIDSLYQLSLLLCLKKRLEVNEISIFDPMFNKNEIKLIENKLHFKLIPRNERSIHSVDSSEPMVMFFMPHCDKSLFNNLLWSNWDSNRIKNLIIFGNSFEKMLETICSEKVCKKYYKYLHQICNGFENVLIEEKIENSFEPKQTFSDLSIHVINDRNISQTMLEMHYDSSEPIYEQNGDLM